MKMVLKILSVLTVLSAVSVFNPVSPNNFRFIREKPCAASGFMMEQDAGNSGGVINRQIDISSPWSGAYLYEEFTVTGSAEVRESFTMGNFGPDRADFWGPDGLDLFGPGAAGIFNFDANEQALSEPGGSSDPNSGINLVDFGEDKKTETASVTATKLEQDDILEVEQNDLPDWFDLF